MLPLEALFQPDEVSAPLVLRSTRDGEVRDYVLREAYCIEPGCDCRRVLLSVVEAHSRRIVATVSHAFEPPEVDRTGLGQTFLDPLLPQSAEAAELLDATRTVLADPVVEQHLRRHYAAVKQAVARPTARQREVLSAQGHHFGRGGGRAAGRRTFTNGLRSSRGPDGVPATAAARSGDVAVLHSLGPVLPRRVRRDISARSREVVPQLVALLAEPNALSEDAPGDGWGAVHAVTLLADLKHVAAIDPVVDSLRDAEIDDERHDRMLLELARFGADALEPLLALYDHIAVETEVLAEEDREPEEELADDEDWDEDWNEDDDDDDDDDDDAWETASQRLAGVCGALVRLRVRDDRIWSRLLARFADDPFSVIEHLRTYRDRRALPALAALLAELAVDSTDPVGLVEVEEVAAAIEAIGGTLDAEQTRKRKRARRLQRRQSEPSGSRRRPRGTAPRSPLSATRNGPCWCGSGRKYKRCHAEADRAAERSGAPKMSDALERLAHPLLREIENDDAARVQGALRLAALAWNAVVIAGRRADDTSNVLQELRAEILEAIDTDLDDAGVRALLDMLVERKQVLFPDDDRIVRDVSVREGPDGLHIQAAWMARPSAVSTTPERA